MNISIKKLAQMYCDYQRIHTSRATYLNTRSYCSYLTNSSYANTLLSNFDEHSAQQFVLSLRKQRNGKNLMLSSLNTIITGIKSLFNYAIRQKLIPINPFANIPLYHTSFKRGFLCETELQMIASYRSKSSKRNHVLNAFLFACFTGLRISDIRTLQWNDIQEFGNITCIYKVMHKTQEPISIPLSSNALRYLPTPSTTSYLVFHHLPPHATVERAIKEAIRTLHIGSNRNITFHSSRHTFATLLLSKGADIYTISKLLGHKNIKTTQIYVEILNETKHRAVSLLDQITL